MKIPRGLSQRAASLLCVIVASMNPIPSTSSSEPLPPPPHATAPHPRSTAPRSRSSEEPGEHHDVIIIGAGLAGLGVAASLARRGFLESSSSDQLCVYERASELRPTGALLGFFPNGATALRSIDDGAYRDVIRECIPFVGLTRFDAKGGVLSETVNAPPTSRAGGGTASGESHDVAVGPSGSFLVWHRLQSRLRECLPDVDGNGAAVLRLGCSFESYEVDDATGLVRVTLRDRVTGRTFVSTCRVLVGADGMRSSVRRCFLRWNNLLPESGDDDDVPLYYRGRTMFRAVLDAGALDDCSNRDLLRPPHGIAHSWTCGEVGKGIVVREAAEGILAVTATVMSEEPDPVVGDGTADDIKRRVKDIFATYPEPVRELLERVPASAIHTNSIYDMNLLEDWSCEGPVILIGDAAHAMTPALGQGANVALEDAAELGAALSAALGSSAANTARDRDDSVVGRTLGEFSSVRVERMREIHRANREETRYKNKDVDASSGERVQSYEIRHPNFRGRLFGWTTFFGSVQD